MDRAGRISILKHRYHVGRHLTGEAVTVESKDGLLHITHNGVVVATHARRHLIDDDDKMDREPRSGVQHLPPRVARSSAKVDPHGSLRRVGSNGIVSVDNQMFSVGKAYKGTLVDAFVDDTTIQVWHQNRLIKAVARWKGPVRKSGRTGSASKIRRSQNVAHQPELDTTICASDKISGQAPYCLHEHVFSDLAKRLSTTVVQLRRWKEIVGLQGAREPHTRS